MNKNVIVLMPNGHRQNIKVTPNTTILQVSYSYIYIYQCLSKPTRNYNILLHTLILNQTRFL